MFHLEAGGSVGWGHLARCAALAAELTRRKCSCVLWTDSGSNLRDVPAELPQLFRDVLPVSPQGFLRPPASVRSAEWIVVDDYAVTDEDLRALRANLASARGPGPRLLVLDDDMKRRLDAADIVSNARLGLTGASYAPRQRVLLGEHYALLRSGLREPAEIVSPFSAEKIPVLIMLGGTDPRGLTTDVVHALADVDARVFAPVVVGGRSGGRADLLNALDRFDESAWLATLDAATLAGWSRICRFAISAAGGTLYELALLNLPFVSLIAADNQRALAHATSERWHLPAVEITGDFRSELTRAFRELVTRLPVSDSSPRARFSDIDGLGAARIANALLAPVGLALR